MALSNSCVCLQEMTQPMGPPLTGIKTPIKGGHSSFAFPQRNGLKVLCILFVWDGIWSANVQCLWPLTPQY